MRWFGTAYGDEINDSDSVKLVNLSLVLRVGDEWLWGGM